MRRDHAEQIWEAISVFLKSPSPKVKEMFIEKIESVNLKPGKKQGQIQKEITSTMLKLGQGIP